VTEDEEAELAARAHLTMAQCEQTAHGCTHPLQLDETYDSYFCDKCDAWMEPTCGDPLCTYCRRRPVVPSLRREARTNV
jgi:hypothetical protein